ncbi:MAG: DUF4381 family protein [Rhizobiaceae bacterium]
MDELIAGLRDVHTPVPPAEISSLPLIAVGIAVLALTVAALLAVRRSRRGWSAEALEALSEAAAEPSAEALVMTATVLRRVALLHGGSRTIKLSGDAWLEELDRQFRTHYFTRDDGVVFGEALYRPAAVDCDATAIVRRVRSLVQRRSLTPW